MKAWRRPNRRSRLFDGPEGQVLTAVVCDGAGSAAYSEVGSWLASQTLLELV
ncbi:protein phosphatase 2C domain-containing protein [Mesorhizobium sp. CA8]|uniref:protein phosphatase 2C domain-containing protein n=1 Tax=unclassified Mesorhizobium TaxID=325217 RepID=UPI001CC97FFA|nr:MULTISPECIES: protein phosphatase 2C domain-containing protein [unclassified Mesorhizobium]MBZ9763970.1 protein phosphatase 2C domain-containing protein [Mesorhizobium sp. CA8]MBZ9822191.1 protein phosphatase 2C domain-containing protein [Mesorhizobium sp. CA4]